MPPENQLVIPSPTRFNDETQRKVEGIEQALPVPQEATRGGQAFAWAPNQAKQAANVVQTREQTNVQRAETVAVNAQVENLKQQIASVDAEIGVVTGQLNAARQRSQAIAADIRSLSGAISAEQTRLSAATTELNAARSSAEAAEKFLRDKANGLYREPITPYNAQPTEEQSAQIKRDIEGNARSHAQLEAFVNRREGGYDQRTGADILTPAQRVAEQIRVAAIEKDYYGGLAKATANSIAAGFSADPNTTGSFAASLAEANAKIADLQAKANALQPTPAATTTSGGQGRASGGYGSKR
jgi:DNA repair exonuclease SbcCD ATPase subunit